MISTKWEVNCIAAIAQNHIYFVPTTSMHRPACKKILSGKYYEPNTHELIRKVYERIPGNLIHAGTFFGDMIPSFSDSIGQNGKVYCFEPVLESYVLAKQCIQYNKITNVVLSNSGLSDRVSTLKIQTNDGKIGGRSFIQKNGDQSITTLTIDMFNIENLTCIQLDVEGHELNALKGAIKTIHQNKPLILIEDKQNACKEFLSEQNYIQSGAIPGLKIWVERNDKRFEEIICGVS